MKNNQRLTKILAAAVLLCPVLTGYADDQVGTVKTANPDGGRAYPVDFT